MNIDSCTFYSTEEERINRTPKNGTRGSWTGQRGKSIYLPTDNEVKALLKEKGLPGMSYEKGVPVGFQHYAVAEVGKNPISIFRYSNFKECDRLAAIQWSIRAYEGITIWTPQMVASWRKEHKYTWHEWNDCVTCIMIPSKINSYFGHLGGIGELKRRIVSLSGTLVNQSKNCA